VKAPIDTSLSAVSNRHPINSTCASSFVRALSGRAIAILGGPDAVHAVDALSTRAP
jgi:hypothetical protein